MIRIERVINFFFYINVVLYMFSLSNIPFLFHMEFINVIPTVLGLLAYMMYYYKARKLPTNSMPSLLLLLLYTFFVVLFWKKFDIDWSLVSILIYVPLIDSENKGFIRGLILVKLFVLMIVVVLSLLGIITDTVYLKLGGVSHSLGFFHPNTLGAVSLSIFFDCFILFQELRKQYFTFFLLTVLYIVYHLTFSRTSIIIAGLGLLIYAFRKILSSYVMNKVVFSITTTGVYLFGMFYSMFYSTSNIFYRQLDIFLTNRVRLGNMYIQRYGFTLFPKSTPNIIPQGWWSSDQLFNDNTFLKFALTQGVIIAVLFLLYILYFIGTKEYCLYDALLILLTFLFLMIEALGFYAFLLTPLLFKFMAVRDSSVKQI